MIYAPRVFWLSASVALLAIAGSFSYFLVVVLPASQRRRDEQTAQLAAAQAKDKQLSDCAEQARRATQDFAKYSTGFGAPSAVTSAVNHYNRKLGKCIVDVHTVDKNSTAEFILDAYEQLDIVWCLTRFTPKALPPMQRTCMDPQNKRIDPAEADKQIDALLRE